MSWFESADQEMWQGKTGRHIGPCVDVEGPWGADHEGQGHPRQGQGIPWVRAGLEDEGYLVSRNCQEEGRHIPKVADAQTMSRRQAFHFVGWIRRENTQDSPADLADFAPTLPVEGA